MEGDMEPQMCFFFPLRRGLLGVGIGWCILLSHGHTQMIIFIKAHVT